MRAVCPNCHRVKHLNRLQAKMVSAPGCRIKCDCGASYHPDTKSTLRSDDSVRSRTQERRTANRFGGIPQKASGALPGLKGDVRAPGKFRIECKFTRRDSYRLRLQDLVGIESVASANEDPIFEIEFQSTHPPKRYVVMPEWLYLHYRARLKGDE